MELKFTVEKNKDTKAENGTYPLHWMPLHGTVQPDVIGSCLVDVEGDVLKCVATFNTGGVKHTINDIVIDEFNPINALNGKYEYGLTLDPNSDENVVIGILLYEPAKENN